MSATDGTPTADANSKTFGATVTYRPGPAVTLTANWIGGPEQIDSSLSPFRQIAELAPTLQLSQQLTLAADAMYGVEKAGGREPCVERGGPVRPVCTGRQLRGQRARGNL